MILLACDQSVRGFALAWTDDRPDRQWHNVYTARLDGGPAARGDEAAALTRLVAVYRWADKHLVDLNPGSVGFESYGFSSRPNTDVVELVGAIKLRCHQMAIPTQTVQLSSARKRVAEMIGAKVPRKGEDAKRLMADILRASGAPTRLIPTHDHADALVILNNMLYTAGARPLV